jgi:hypothetical protein
MILYIDLLFWLLVAHAAADYWMQSDSLAKMKNRNRNAAEFCPPGQKPQKMWFYALTAHALMHGAAVYLVAFWFTHDPVVSLLLGTAETIHHWYVDFGKCENWYGIHTDQSLHILVKIVWLVVIAGTI